MKNTAPCIKISFSSPKSPKVSSVFCLKNMTHPVCIAYPPSAIRHFRGPLKSPFYNCKEESSSICSVKGPIKNIYGRDWAYIIRLIIEYYIEYYFLCSYHLIKTLLFLFVLCEKTQLDLKQSPL